MTADPEERAPRRSLVSFLYRVSVFVAALGLLLLARALGWL